MNKQDPMSLESPEPELLSEEPLEGMSAADRAEVDKAWLAELHRRYDAYKRGETTTSTVEEVIARILSRERT